MKNQKASHLCPYHEKEILDYCKKAGYLVMDINAKHVMELHGLRKRPGAALTNLDPFDRMLIAQAKTERSILLSHDRNFEYYGEDCIQAI